MPTVKVAGGRHDMPRIQGPDYGASERFSVAPGHESEGYFEMPGGQSGHPLSPFYRAGFTAWVEGRTTPFLPGPGHTHSARSLRSANTLRRASGARDLGALGFSVAGAHAAAPFAAHLVHGTHHRAAPHAAARVGARCAGRSAHGRCSCADRRNRHP